jgi:4-amino-4-deoxy-L-arabinose transferase-like glycosyltransferase
MASAPEHGGLDSPQARVQAPHVASMKPRLPRAVWLAAAVGIVMRLAFSLGYWVDKPLTHDEHEYLLLARNVAEGRGFVHLQADGAPAAGEHFGRAPVYPAFLAGIIRLTGIPPPADAAVLRAVRVTQAALGGGLVWLVAWLAWNAAGRTAGAAAGWLAALYPPLVWTPAYIWSETLFSVLALGCAAVLSRERRGAGVYVGAGALAGLAVLTRPAMLFFLPLAALWLAWKREWRGVVLLSLACALVIMPWTIRNAREYGRFVLVASEGGITFWTGNHPLAVGEGDLAANPRLKRENVALRARHPGLTPEQLEPIYYREALGFIRERPAAWAGLMARKAFYAVVPVGPSYRLHSALYFGASLASYLAVLPFALMGLARLARAGRLPAPLLLLAASSVVVCLVFFPQERFRIPVVDPTLLVTAASWWALRA